jgi:hypothetical protein
MLPKIRNMRALSIRQPYAELIPSASSGQALRGIKTVELRSRLTRIVGERFYNYACKAKASPPAAAIWSDDLRVAAPPPPAWMIELAEQVRMIEPGALLPTGVIVGSAVISRCEALRHEGTEARSEGQGGRMEVNPLIPDPSFTPSCLRASMPSCLYAWPTPSCLRASMPSCLYAWHLADARRAKRLRKPSGHPQPSWFNPF